MRRNDAAELAREKIDVPWDDLRAARVQAAVVAGLHDPPRARKPRGVRPWAAFAAVALFSLLASVLYVRFHAISQHHTLELADGSYVVADADASVAPERVLPELIELRQTGGSAIYEVTPHPERRFVVRMGDLRVEVLGTGFRVEQLAAAVRVSVTHGRVRVSRGSREVILLAGDQVVLGDEEAPGMRATTSASPSASISASRVEMPASSASDAPSHTRSGGSVADDGTAAPDSSAESGAVQRNPSEPNAAELFRRADEARKQGNLDEAVRLLRELVQKYPDDGRATLAVFTIGRVEAQRHDYAAAASAFESCGSALSGESLAEAALARSAGGQPDRARALALRYIDRYPDGPRAKELERLAE